MFKRSNSWTGLFKSLGYSVMVMPLIPLASTKCAIKRLGFRIRNCRKGNTDPCIELR